MKIFYKIIFIIFVSLTTTITTSANTLDVFVDGNQVDRDEIHLVNDSVYMSLRELSKYNNYSVQYDDKSHTVNFFNDSENTSNLINSTNTNSNNSISNNDVFNNLLMIENKEIILFPTNVSNIINSSNSRSIVKTYELSDFENPNDIPTNSFNQDGYYYNLTDITKTGNITTDNREHVKSVTVNTESNNVNTILNELEHSIQVTTEDGFTGTLQLDINSIKSEVTGYQNSNYTLTQTREYPNLSSPDTSLIPKSIDVSGTQYNLGNITWENNNKSAEYTGAIASYTAIATYSATATKSTLTGYTTTADYKGIVSKVIDGKIIYTAYFDGVPIELHYENMETQIIASKDLNDLINNSIPNNSLLESADKSEEISPNSDEQYIEKDVESLLNQSSNLDSTSSEQDTEQSILDEDTNNCELDFEPPNQGDIQDNEFDKVNNENHENQSISIGMLILIPLLICLIFVGAFGFISWRLFKKFIERTDETELDKWL